MALYEYKALCTRVIDGDSIVCDIDLGFSMVMHGQQIRLAGIDTPESRTRDKREKFYGKYATAWLKERIEGKVVTLRTELDGKGKFGRILAKVYFGRRFINNQMVEGNMAVAYHGQSKDLVKQQHKTNFMKLEEQGVKPE